MSQAPIEAAPSSDWLSGARAAAPGLMLSGALALAAYALGQMLNGPSVLYALIGGLTICGATTGNPMAQALAPGLDLGARFLLRVGVVCLGARVTLQNLGDLGVPVLALTIGALGASLTAGLALARTLKIGASQAAILAGAVAICGASAALAIAAALPKHRESETAAAVAGVTAIGALGMLLYPLAAHLLDFSARETGIFLGASLHEVAQAVGAGFAVSPVAGETATAVKLLRVACLGPVVMIVARVSASGRARLAPPWFVTGFAALALLASFGLLPHVLVAGASALSQWLLLIAIAALGLKTAPALLLKVGARPLVLLTAQTLLLATLVAGALIALR